ncbi:MAG: hypothetical protein QOE41_3422 [Mycobacterium sp.]|jgi:hypothetical protein|nr:PucR family transcriptional regulator [Mycobacterium sp.]MDT5134111.1 hypothetical protein [Mycobacterium sp.]
MPSGDGAAPPGDIDLQVCEIGAELGRRVEELGRDIAATIRADIDFYKHTRVVTDEELLTSSTETIRFIINGPSIHGQPAPGSQHISMIKIDAAKRWLAPGVPVCCHQVVASPTDPCT